MPKWMSGIDALPSGKALGLGLGLSSLNPKNLILAVGAAAGLAQLDLSISDAAVSLTVFVVLASSTVAGAVGDYFLGGDSARGSLEELKARLGRHTLP